MARLRPGHGLRHRTGVSACSVSLMVASVTVVVTAGPRDNRWMAEEPATLDPGGSGREPEREQATSFPLETETEGTQPSGWSRLRALQDRLERFEKSAAGRYWSHLSAADFMNSSFAFSALAVLSAFPLLAVSSSVIGGDVRKAIVARMGLNAQATRDVEALIATGNQAVATLTWFSAIVLVLGGVGMASTLSAWYHRIYEQTPSKGFFRHFAYQSAGVVAFILFISVEVWLFDKVRPVGGRGLLSAHVRVRGVSGGGRPTCSCIAESRCGNSSLLGWQPEPALPVLESCLRSSSRTRSPPGRRAMALLASFWR